MNGRWGDLEVGLEVTFRLWSAIDLSVRIDEGQILSLHGSKGRWRGCWGSFRHKESLSSLVLTGFGGADEVNVRYRVELSETERLELKEMIGGGKQAVRRLKRAQILLASDAGRSETSIAQALGVGVSTVYRTRRRFVEGNLEGALSEEARAGGVRKLSGKEEALLGATACSKAPAGCARWTLKLLAGRMVELTEHAQLSRETIRRRLHEKELKPWQRKMWCIAKVDGEYIARMEDALDLYAEQPDLKHPVVSFDESPQQLIGEVREPTAVAPGQAARYDSEYKRTGTANLRRSSHCRSLLPTGLTRSPKSPAGSVLSAAEPTRSMRGTSACGTKVCALSEYLLSTADHENVAVCVPRIVAVRIWARGCPSKAGELADDRFVEVPVGPDECPVIEARRKHRVCEVDHPQYIERYTWPTGLGGDDRLFLR